MKSTLPKKFMSLREKNGSHRRSKSSEPGHKNTRPSSSDVFFSYFKSDAAKQAAREEEEKEKIAAQIDDIAARLDELNFHNVSKEHIRFTLFSKFAEGDADKAMEFLQLQQQAFSGIIVPYDPNVQMVGAENRGNVTCYLDALLFAMFAKLHAFECMLKNDLPEQPQRKLATLIRLWVNMLRSGKMIHTDITEHLQVALAECGWADARLLEQQDTSEAFAFITETLQLPLLTLQVDLFHQGKNDADDHKVVYERLLNLAVPPDPEGKGINLEDCLEDYFNTQVDVQRDRLEEKRSLGGRERSPLRIENTIRLVPADDIGMSESPTTTGEGEGRKSESFDRDPAPLQRRWTIVEPPNTFPGGEGASSSSSTDPRVTTASGRQRSASIIQRFVLEEGKPKTSTPESSQFMEQFKRQGSTIVKAITIPAWQFFRLIPWHSTSNSEPKNDIDVARQFNQRPVVGICLKRYMMNEAGQFIRQNTYIDIPDSLRLPHFMMGEDERLRESSELNAEYKLVLQSVVCHRGISLHSGHYVSFSRVNPKVLTENRRCDDDPPPDYEEEQWVKFDDLAVENRVAYVEDIRQALKEEMPYLLFYQIVPMVDLSPSSTEDGIANPPSYNDSTTQVGDIQGQPDSDRAGPERPTFRRQNTAPSNAGSSFIDPSTWGSSTTGPSIRFSSENDQPPRISFDQESNTSSSMTGVYRKGDPIYSRRGSLTFTESGVEPSPAVTPEGGESPVISAAVPANDESAAQRLSRAASRWTTKSSSRSRPVSQTGEGRISLTMSRLGLTRTKEPQNHSEEGQEGLTALSAVTTPSTTPSAAIANNPLSAIVTAPAAAPSLSENHPSQANLDPSGSTTQTLHPPVEQAQVDDGRRHHHHHHHHMRMGKPKSRDKTKEEDDHTITDATATGSGPSSGKGKGKEKEKNKNKTGVPERECIVM